MADSSEGVGDGDRVRQIVREEIAKISSGQNSAQNVYARTQGMIRNAANAYTAELRTQQGQGAHHHQQHETATSSSMPRPNSSSGTSTVVSTLHYPLSTGPYGFGPRPSLPGAISTTPASRFSGSYYGKRKSHSQPGHPWRLRPEKMPKQKPDKLIYAWLLDCSEDTKSKEHYFTESMVLLKGYVNINPAETDLQIRSKITALFTTKFPAIVDTDYEYVKRDRSVVSMPVTQPGFIWDFQSIKGLMGQGKLYCRVCKTSRKALGIEEEAEVSSDDNELVQVTFDSKMETDKASDDTEPHMISQENINKMPDVEEPLPGCSHQPTSAEIDIDTHEESELLSLVNELLDKQNEKNLAFDSTDTALAFLRGKLCSDKIRLRVQPQYALEEALAHYKAPEFNPKVKMNVQYRGQAAIDTGGVLRQFFTDVFMQMVTGCEDVPPLFEGSTNRKLPICSAGTVVSGVFELVGKIIAHSIVQAGVGMPYFSPASFKYLVTSDLSEAINYVTIEDVTNPAIKHYIDKV